MEEAKSEEAKSGEVKSEEAKLEEFKQPGLNSRHLGLNKAKALSMAKEAWH